MLRVTTIQERLWELRKDKGLNLEELAQQTGISKSAPVSYTHLDVYKRQISSFCRKCAAAPSGLLDYCESPLFSVKKRRGSVFLQDLL